MGKYRYTIDELENKSDSWLLLRIINDRMDSLTNVYSPLYRRLSQLQKKIVNKEKLSNNLVKGQWFEEDGR